MPFTPAIRKVVTSGFLISLSVSLFTPAAFAETPETPVDKEKASSTSLNEEIADLNTAGEKRYIVRYEKNTDVAEESQVLKEKGLEVKNTMTTAIDASVVIATPQEIEEVKKSEDVASVELDYKVSIASATNIWGLDRVDQRSGRDGQYNVPDGGAGVDVYVVDTGINPNHVEFKDRIPQAWSGVYDGRGFADCSGHGTHVSGTIAGTTYGVAKKANIIPVRALDCNGQAWASTIMSGIDWAVSYHQAGQPAVMNLSIGGFVGAAFEQTVQSAVNDGITVVAAAGNAGQDACWTSPANVRSAITVGATDINDTQVTWGNYGSCVDIMAPGVGIVSSGINAPTGYYTESGTSMAAPHVAGAAAIMLSQNRGMSPAQVHDGIIANSTTGAVRGIIGATPNRMLYVPAAAPVAPVITSMEVADYTTTAAVNFRTGPGTQNSIIKLAASGTTVNGTGRKSDIWYEVKLDGQTGWMSSDYLVKKTVVAPVVIVPVTSSIPTISGTAKVGSVMTANAGAWGPSGVALAYQWKANGSAIAGATASTYTIGAEQVGKALTVAVTGSKSGTTDKVETSSATPAVAKASLTTVSPKMTGLTKVGYRLSVAPGEWGPAPVAISYQWYRDGVAISGATASSYLLTGSDYGKKISIRVTGRKDGYIAVYRQLTTSVTVASGDLKGAFPTVTGKTSVGNTLTASPGLWTAGTSVSYQWFRDGVAVPGATSKYLKLTEADRGHQLKIRVIGKKAGYSSRGYMSLPTAKIV